MTRLLFTMMLLSVSLLAGCYDYPEPARSTVSNRGNRVTEYHDKSLRSMTRLQVERQGGQLEDLAGNFKKGETITVVATVNGIDVERAQWLLVVQEPDGTNWSREICRSSNVSGQRSVRKEYDITLGQAGKYILVMQCMGTNFRVYQISVN